jgi:hypothetical protein
MSYLNTHESTAEVFAHRPADICTDEWQVRVDLAAAYRLVAHFGWDDLIFTHLSARYLVVITTF